MNNTVAPALSETHFDWIGSRYAGKVRDSYVRGEHRVLIATDRLSAFDRILTTVPGKGQVLTQLAHYWFKRSSSVAENHVVAVPDPCVMIGREVSIIPIEVVVRGFLAGSAWRDYTKGVPISGVSLPTGLGEFDQLPEPIITPSTKEAMGQHDTPISETEIVERGIVKSQVWEEVRSLALALFSMAARDLSQRGLLFADTKYEFGMLYGRVVLADEIHTLDCSRFWVAESYEDRRRKGEAPEMLDKEPIRRWLLERGFCGEGEPPVIPDSYRAELTAHYARSYERITGQECLLDRTAPNERIERNLRAYFDGNRA
jgi:phosphoribosylaminoimidazole-succinocarboxamide synthase